LFLLDGCAAVGVYQDEYLPGRHFMAKQAEQTTYDARISLWFEANTNSYSEKAIELVRAEVSPTLEKLEKVEVRSGPVQYRLDQAGCEAITGLLRRVKKGETTRLQNAKVTLLPSDEERQKAMWYVIRPVRPVLEIDGVSKGLVSVRADRVKGRDPVRMYCGRLLMSETFVSWVKNQKLTGLEFLWCVDKGKHAAEQWYSPVATAFLGRGIDHAWFDPVTRGQFQYEGYAQVQPTEPEWIHGVTLYSAQQLRDGIKTHPAGLGELLEELKATETKYPVTIKAPMVMLKAFLPQSDFAYLRVAAGVGDDAAESVRLCCNRPTRGRMIAAGMLKSEDFEPMLVQEDAGGAQVFDRKDSAIQNQFSPKELVKVRALEASFLEKAKANPKPVMPVKGPEITKVLLKVKKRVKEQGRVAPGATQEELAKAGEKTAIPARWAQLLAGINGFEIDDAGGFDGDGVRIASTKGLAKEHKSCLDMITGGWPDMPKTYLGVGSTMGGDCLFLDTGKVTGEGDCPVVWVDHETSSVSVTWPAIGIFLLEAVEREEG
jgi:hypothetical protein